VSLFEEAERICKTQEGVEACPGHRWVHHSYHIQVKQWVGQTEHSDSAWQQKSGEQAWPQQGDPYQESSASGMRVGDDQLPLDLCSTADDETTSELTEDEANSELEWDTESDD
jgi:hypothetical protein